VEVTVMLQKDKRKCAAPRCGGYFLFPVNRKALGQRQYVSGLDFTGSGLGLDDIDDVNEAPTSQLVIIGVVSPPANDTNTSVLTVKSVFRGLPGQYKKHGDRFYRVSSACVKDACGFLRGQTLVANKLNHAGPRASASISVVDVTGAAESFVQRSWLRSRVQSGRAIVAARIARDNSTQLVLHQVYLQVPEHIDACPRRSPMSCKAGLVPTYKRDVNRCRVRLQCAKPGRKLCTEGPPSCGKGYTRRQYRALTQVLGTNRTIACMRYTCEPTFTLEKRIRPRAKAPLSCKDVPPMSNARIQLTSCIKSQRYIKRRLRKHFAKCLKANMTKLQCKEDLRVKDAGLLRSFVPCGPKSGRRCMRGCEDSKTELLWLGARYSCGHARIHFQTKAVKYALKCGDLSVAKKYAKWRSCWKAAERVSIKWNDRVERICKAEATMNLSCRDPQAVKKRKRQASVFAARDKKAVADFFAKL